MPAAIYDFALKSEEVHGASQPNILRIGLASDADAAIFAANLESLFSADVVTANKKMDGGLYTKPYPAGTDRTWRVSMKSDENQWDTQHLLNIKSSANAADFAASLPASHALLPNWDLPAVESVLVTDVAVGQFR